MNYPKNRYTGQKPWMDYDWLYNEYVVKDRSTNDIANEYGCKQNTIQCWLIKHGIKKIIKKRNRKVRKQYETYEYLYHNHIELHKSMADIAKENNVSQDTIRYNLIKNGIKYWRTISKKKYSEEDIDTIVNLYCNDNMSANEIAKIFGTGHKVIINYLKDRQVHTRCRIEAQYNANHKEMHKDLFDADLLYKLHWEEGYSCKRIGEIYGIDARAARRQMNRIGVPTKSNSESKKGLMVGKKHPNWKGGVTPLNLLLREYFTVNLAPKILIRDNYTCQACGKSHCILHVHHIDKFSTIIANIREEHPDLNPSDLNDRAKLYDIITKDQKFLDENNLITFCKDCHFRLIHDYNYKTISSQTS